MGTFLGALRIESIVGDGLGIIAMAMLLQMGGIPIPDRKSPLGTFLWALLVFVIGLQCFTSAFSIVCAMSAFFTARETLSPCAVEWKGGIDLVDVWALGSFSFQPVILTPLILMSIYFAAIIECIKVNYPSFVVVAAAAVAVASATVH